MGGRPTVVGLLAVAVAVLLASAVAPSPAAAEFGIPGLFESKPKVVKRKRFRPTIPNRNPTRVTAGVSADAVSPKVADNSEAAAVAGTSSSASVALALPAPARKEEEKEPQSESNSDDGADKKDAASETAMADAQGDAAEPADTKPGDEASSGEATSETTSEDAEPAQAEAATDEADAVATGTVETVAVEAADEETDTPDEAPVETAALVQPTQAADIAEPEVETPPAPAEPETAETEEPSKPEAEAEPVERPDKTARPSNDASVVLQVSPPPEASLTPVVAPEDEAAPPAEPEETEKADDTDDADETEVAILTPPSAPAADTPEPTEADAGEPAALDTAPSDDEKVDAEESAGEESAAEDEDAVKDEIVNEVVPQAESADDEPSSESTAVSDETAETPAEDAVAEEAAPPPPPPAHPVVAEIRTKLEDPGRYKAVAASDLNALKEFYGTYEGPPLWVTDIGFTEKAKAIMAEIGKADDWGLKAASYDLPPEADLLATPNAHADDELQLSIAILSYARDAQIGRLSPSSVSKLFDQHPSLRDPKTVLTEMAASDAPNRYLLSLHPQHTQFKRLQEALVRARDSAKATGRDPNSDRKVQLIVINMERWRWLPRQLGNYYVWNNVPEFNVRVIKGDQTIYQEKTIVGQYKYATPLFSASMRNIVFHPNWTVPPTIIKEDLVPKLQGPSGGGFFGNSKEATLKRYGLSANYKGQRINADTVDWNNVNIHAYTFTQDPGPANVLGQFKFNFPNKHAIYMHDTPQRELFAETTRTLSHGCIRVNQPDRFAALLLGEDKGWSMGNVQSLVNKGPQDSTVISLNRHVPVHLTYFTANVEQYGTVNAFGDIYGIDNRMAAKLFANPASFPVPATPAVAEEESSSRTQTSQRRRNNGFDSFISGLFGN